MDYAWIMSPESDPNVIITKGESFGKIVDLAVSRYGRPFRLYDKDNNLLATGRVYIEDTALIDSELVFKPFDDFGMEYLNAEYIEAQRFDGEWVRI